MHASLCTTARVLITAAAARALAGAMAPPARVLVVAGPTAVGKSSAALRLCEARDGELVSADSVQLYRGLDVGSNKPSSAELKRVRHHLVDVADASKPWSAGAWCDAAAEAIGDVARRGKLPVVVGGTMMYAQWLVRGAPDAPKASATAAASAQEFLAPHGDDWEKARNAVAERSEACATRVAKLSQNDFYRLSRALEIELDREAGGGSGEARRPVLGSDFDVRCAFLAPADRTALYHAIDERCDVMLARGLLEETANLRATGRLPSSSTAARAIGYRQALDYLEARVSGEADASLESYVDFCRQFRTASRNYAAEQLKWYRRDATFAIVPAGDDAALATLLDLDRGAYDAFLRSDAQAAARNGLSGDPKAMKTFASRPCAAEADPETALARAAAAVARYAEADSVSGDNVRLAELRRRDGVGD